MAETHYFDVNVAKIYGVNCAVILQNLFHWINKNKANNQNEYDGNYWTYNSKKAFSQLFPYMNERQIDYALQKLIADGVVITGNYNKVAYDRTLWYAITKKGYSILQNCEMETTKLLNGNNNIVQPIPNINTDKETTNNNTDIIYIVEYLNEKAKTAYRVKSKDTQKHIQARLKEGYKLEDFKTVIDKQCEKWKGTEFEQYLRPATLFGSKFENYLNAKSITKHKTSKNDGFYFNHDEDSLDDLF